MYAESNLTQPGGDGIHDGSPPRMACTLCRRRKMRCNRKVPCESCMRLGFECVYETPKSQQAIRRPRAQKTKHDSDTTGSSSHSASRTSPESGRASASLRKALHPSVSRSEWKPDQMSKETMAELEQVYFATIHQSVPILHHSRYNTAALSEPRLRPPSYLRHIICALGALVSPKHNSIHDALYRSARKLLEDTELNDGSMTSIAITRPQTWILLAIYELLQMQFYRWWTSTARSVRLCQIMGLHVLDGPRPYKRFQPVAKDWTEIEEQRRTFWMAFSLDRYAAFGRGCPMIIDEKDIRTLLPVSEEVFESCTEMKTMTLREALNSSNNIAELPPASAAIVLIAETGYKLKRLQQNDLEGDGRLSPTNIWQKINWLDDTLHYAFSVPPHLAASGFAHTPILTFLHMCAPTSTILLHQAAEEQASSHGITPSSLLESQALRLAAAEMVASTMRLAGHIDVRLLHPFTGPCLYNAARVLMRSLAVRADESQQFSLKILLDALGQLQAVNPSTGGYFKDLDAEFPGMRDVISARTSSSPHDSSILEGRSTDSPYTPPTSVPQSLGYDQDLDFEYKLEGLGGSDMQDGDLDLDLDHGHHGGGHDRFPSESQESETADSISFSERDFFEP